MILYTAYSLDDAKQHLQAILESFAPIVTIGFSESPSPEGTYTVIFLQSEGEKKMYDSMMREFTNIVPTNVHWEMDPQILIDLIDKFGK